MQKIHKRLLLAFFAISLILFAGAAWAAYQVISTPALKISVQERGGQNFSFAFPGALAMLGINAMPLVIPDEVEADLHHDLGPLSPMIQELMMDLEALPDARLVTVEDRNDTVVIAKEGQTFHITVHDAEVDVDIEIPLQLVVEVMEVLG